MSIQRKMFCFIKKVVDKAPLLFIPIYFLSYLIPRNKKIWLFGSNMGKSFGDNPKYLYLFINELNNKGIRPIWISGDESIVTTLQKNGYEAYSIYSFKGIYYSMRASIYIFDHHTKDICFWFSGGAVKINLFHGIPLKKIHGDNKFDEVRNPPNIYKRIRWSIRRLQNEKPSHYYLATSEYVKKIFASAFRTSLNKGIVCGYPRNDILFNADYLNNIQILTSKDTDIYNRLVYERSNCDKKVIIYMPTHRKSEDKLSEIMDFDRFNKFLESNNTVILIKAHPMSKMQSVFKDISYSNIINLDAYEDPYPFLSISDILITDYSSVYFDFLLTNKPIIFFSYDLETYINESRELYYDYDSVTPGHKVVDMNGLMESIESYLSGNDGFDSERQRVLNMMFEYKDGKSSERLYKKICEIIKNNDLQGEIT